MIPEQLVLPYPGGPWWRPPEPRRVSLSVVTTDDGDPAQISMPQWLWAFGHPEDVEKFCAIPQAVLAALIRWSFTETEHDVLAAILLKQYQWHKDGGGLKAIGAGDFVWMTHHHKRTVWSALETLERLAVITVRRPGRRRRNFYAVNPPDQWQPKTTRRQAPYRWSAALEAAWRTWKDQVIWLVVRLPQDQQLDGLRRLCLDGADRLQSNQ